MNNGKELQKDDIYLPGDLGYVTMPMGKAEIVQEFRSNDGAVTLVLHPITISEKIMDDNTLRITCERLITSIKHKQLTDGTD